MIKAAFHLFVIFLESNSRGLYKRKARKTVVLVTNLKIHSPNLFTAQLQTSVTVPTQTHYINIRPMLVRWCVSPENSPEQSYKSTEGTHILGLGTCLNLSDGTN